MSDGAGTNAGVGARLSALSGMLVLLAVAWSTPLGEISPDTKTDLYIDPVSLMARSLHLWDPQVTWGVLQNQGYGYLFPMGPFFATVGAVVPMWVAQRLWWSTLLAVGYLGMVWLLRELGVRPAWVTHLGGLAYALSPRVITTLGGLSSESLPTLLAPLVLAPLVASSNARLAPRRAAAFSGLAILGCGGVNATATLLALVPAGIWLLSRWQWWRQRLTWWWTFAVVCAISWWAIPLVLLGRYSPPFLDWIENARMVTSPVGLLDAVRGTSHWLGHLVTASGPWWPAGYQMVSDPWVILATALLAALGLAGLALPAVPHRGFLLAVLITGLVVIAVPHSGALASPLAGPAQELLDGPLSPFRNIHKGDPLVRLPLTLGLAVLLARLAAARPSGASARGRHVRLLSSGLVGAVALGVVWGASPGMDGHLAPRGTFADVPESWRDAADWLSENAAGERSLIVPAASFAEYTWGRPLDEPLRPLTEAPYAVRDAVPLTPANTVRFLDAVEQRLQSGRDVEAAVAALARSGVGYLVLRNDLDTEASGTPPVIFAGSSLRSTPSLRLTARFGRQVRDVSGVMVSAVEIYEVTRRTAEPVEVWPVDALTAVAGASEALPSLAERGPRAGPVVFDGDVVPELADLDRVETDTYSARERFFGVTRGQDVSSQLTRDDDRDAPDYRPWDEDRLRSAVTFEGARSVSASSSIATHPSIVGLRPAYRPYAALDGDGTTAWLTYADSAPILDLQFDRPVSPSAVSLTPYADERVFGRALGVATHVAVETDGGSVVHEIDPDGGPQAVPGVGGPTRRLRIEILDTTRGEPGRTLTGLSEVSLPGVAVSERVSLGPVGAGLTQRVLLGTGSTGSADGCLRAGELFRCVSGQFRPAEETTSMRRAFSVAGEGEFAVSGSLSANPLKPLTELLLGPEIESVTGSSVRAFGAAGAPTAAFDLDSRTAWSPAPDDPAPRLTATFSSPVTLKEIQLRTRDGWTRRYAAVVRVNVDGDERFGRLTSDGRLAFSPMSGRTVSITFVREVSRDDDPIPSLEIEEVGLAGVSRVKPPGDVVAECGSGPELQINGVPFATRVSGDRDAALGFGALSWAACSSVGFGYLQADTLDVSSWRGMSPSSTVLERLDASDLGQPVELQQATGVRDLVRVSPTRLRASVGAGPERVVVMNDNTNPGWEAAIGETPLTPVTIDGFRQGFLLPEGTGGTLSIRFAPDSVYRLGLAAGLLLALLLVPLSIRSETRIAVVPATTRRSPALAATIGTLAVAVLLAGPWGALLVSLLLLGFRHQALACRRSGLVAGLVLSAGLVEAVAQSSGLGPRGVELTTRILVLLAIGAVFATPTGRPAPRGSGS